MGNQEPGTAVVMSSNQLLGYCFKSFLVIQRSNWGLPLTFSLRTSIIRLCKGTTADVSLSVPRNYHENLGEPDAEVQGVWLAVGFLRGTFNEGRSL